MSASGAGHGNDPGDGAGPGHGGLHADHGGADPVGVAEVRDLPERWEVVESVARFRGRIIGVRSDRVRMANGDTTEVVARDVVEHPGSVGVLALDDDDRVLLIRQYRHPVGYRLWEMPAGLRDVAGEPTRATAERELIEEAGYRAERWHTLIDYFTSPGMCDERIRVFLARGPSPVSPEEFATLTDADGRPFRRIHEEADMAVLWLPLDEAVDKVLKGHIHNAMAAMGILAAYAARASGFRGLRSATAPEA
jgi:8-oxo-dGDP phosphatase